MNNSLNSQTPLSQRRLTSIRDEVSEAHHSFEPTLLRRALFKTNNIETSQDLVQTTFLKTLQYLQRGGQIHLMRGFLSHVLNDLITDGYRKHKTQSLDILLEKGFEPGVDEQQRQIDMIDGRMVLLLLAELPKKYEQVLELRYVKGLTITEVALLTDQSENTVAVQAHRGLVKLRVLYEEKCNKTSSTTAL